MAINGIRISNSKFKYLTYFSAISICAIFCWKIKLIKIALHKNLSTQCLLNTFRSRSNNGKIEHKLKWVNFNAIFCKNIIFSVLKATWHQVEETLDEYSNSRKNDCRGKPKIRTESHRTTCWNSLAQQLRPYIYAFAKYSASQRFLRTTWCWILYSVKLSKCEFKSWHSGVFFCWKLQVKLE